MREYTLMEVQAFVHEDREVDDLTYAGPVRMRLKVKVLFWDRMVLHEISNVAVIKVVVGSSGMDPKTVEAREQMRRKMMSMLRELARDVKKHTGIEPGAVVEAGKDPIWKASGE